MASLQYGDLQNKTYGDLQNMTYAFEGDTGNITDPPAPTSLSSEDIAAIASAIWNYNNKVVTVESTQAATFQTATGFATPSNITDAKNAIITEGNSKWKTATGFVTSLNGIAQESSLTSIGTLIETIIALLADWSVDDTTLTISVGGTEQTYTITKSGDNITAVHPDSQQ